MKKSTLISLLFVVLLSSQVWSHGPQTGKSVQLKVVDAVTQQIDGVQTVDVSLFEWGITTSVIEVQPGTVAFVISNDGAVAHAFTITGNGVLQSTPVFGPTESKMLQLELGPGDYDLWCPVPGHRPLGMGTGFAAIAGDKLPDVSIERAIDVNDNGLIDDAEILQAIQLWVAGDTVRGPNQPITDTKMLDLIRLWATGQSI